MFKPPIKRGSGAAGRVLPIATITNQKGIIMNNYDTVSGGYVVNSLFGNMDATNATDRVGFIVKYT